MNLRVERHKCVFDAWIYTNLPACVAISEVLLFLYDPSVNSTPNKSEAIPLADAFTGFKQLLLPVIDRNPYLTDGTKQVCFFFCCFKKIILW